MRLQLLFFLPGSGDVTDQMLASDGFTLGWDDPFLCSLLNLKYDGTSSPWNNYNHHSEKV